MKNYLKIAALLALSLATGLSSFVSASSSGGVGGRPANPDPDNSRTQSIFIYTLDSGGKKEDQLYLSNGSDTDQTVQIYAVDGTISNTGAFTCKQQVEARTGIGKAIVLSKNEVTIPANGSQLVDFTLTLPEAIDVGEHNGCLVIQKKEDSGQQATGSIQVHTRTAVRVAVLVPGNIHREVSITDFVARSSYKKGDQIYIGPEVQFGLKNTGNVSADVAVSVHVKNIFGRDITVPGRAGQTVFFSGQYPVIAGTTFAVNYNAEFHPFFGGWYKVKADIVYNEKPGTFGVDTSKNVIRSESQEVTIFFWPSVGFFLTLALLVLAALSFLAWRVLQSREASKRAHRSLKRSVEKPMWGLYEVQERDTLAELAKGTGVPVNKIAIMNKLRAPYTLEPGQRIYVPQKKK